MANETSSKETAEPTPEASPLEQFMAIADVNGGLDDGPTVDGKATNKAAEKPQGPKPADWAKVREERRQARASIERDRAAIAAEQAQVDAARRAIEHVAPDKIQELLDLGDLDEIAKRVSGGKFESWNAVNDYAARAFASPEARHTRKLAEEVERLKAERAEENRIIEAQQAEYQRQQAEREFFTYIDTEVKAATDPVVKALAAEPEFTQAVYGHMAEHYRATGEQLDVSDAAQFIANGARRRYAEWKRVFGGQPAVQQPARQTKHVARTRAAEVASPARELDDKQFISEWKIELKRALDDDMRRARE